MLANFVRARNAQLATFVTSMVVLDAVERLGIDAAGHAGHSLGEYSALTASGALGFRTPCLWWSNGERPCR
ncbi:MAG: hypothetical protein CM1200mP26_15820 [Acidimicrobiales bacterium]|nr:MAG: hypothetical protein CM1200mP26_15820 [Acidimicrobiales bacterium]